MQVIKFGGSSVANATRLSAAAAIVARHQRSSPVVVVVSALGGITDQILSAAYSWMTEQDGWRSTLDGVEERHRVAYRERTGQVPLRFVEQWSALRAELMHLPHTNDPQTQLDVAMRFSGWGERLSTALFAASLAATGSATEALTEPAVILASAAIPITETAPTASVLATRAWLTPQVNPLLQRGIIPIVPGYIARDGHGHDTTLGRNGSDYAAAVVAAALGASALYIYSDVAGIYTADPHQYTDAVLYTRLTYAEARTIALSGAKVLHSRTLEPLAQSHIPLHLRSALAPDAPGTDISAHTMAIA